jgi:SAM-dependent methyltransferase
MAESGDRWARWLGERRFAGDEETRARAFANLLIPLRDAVLDGAEPIAGATVLDIGCGDGLIAFGAIDRGAAEVVFADISSDLLVQCQDLADAAGVRRRCRFEQAPAEDLGAVETGSVDAVTVRSVLIYIADKRAAFREFARVLRPGGRLSIFEPINRFGQREWTGSRFFGVDLAPVCEIAENPAGRRQAVGRLPARRRKPEPADARRGDGSHPDRRGAGGADALPAATDRGGRADPADGARLRPRPATRALTGLIPSRCGPAASAR